MLVNPGVLTTLPGVSMASKAYKVIKSSAKPRQGGAIVSPCLKKWYTCLTEPFSAGATASCIPSGGNHASKRNFAFTRFDAVVGVNKYGIVSFHPSLSNNTLSVLYSDATYAGTGSTVLATAANTLAAGLVQVALPTNPYTFAQLTLPSLANAQATGRLVGGGFRVNYTGKAVNLGGLMYIYTAPNHAPADSDPIDSLPYTIGDLGALQECIIKPVAREVQEFVLAPQIEEEILYGNYSSNNRHVYPWSANNLLNGFVVNFGVGGIGAPTTVIVFSGTPGETLHFEYGMHSEFIGPLTEGQRLPAESDPVGVDIMMAAVSNATIDVASGRDSFAASLKKHYKMTLAGQTRKVAL